MRSKYPDRDADVIRRFVAGECTKQIAYRFGISGERVYQIVKFRTGLNRRKLRIQGNFDASDIPIPTRMGGLSLGRAQVAD